MLYIFVNYRSIDSVIFSQTLNHLTTLTLDATRSWLQKHSSVKVLLRKADLKKDFFSPAQKICLGLIKAPFFHLPIFFERSTVNYNYNLPLFVSPNEVFITTPDLLLSKIYSKFAVYRVREMIKVK